MRVRDELDPPTFGFACTNAWMAQVHSQFASEVVNFSSQYGTNGTHTYTACNLAGSLKIYDGYGDRTEAFVLVRATPTLVYYVDV